MTRFDATEKARSVHEDAQAFVQVGEKNGELAAMIEDLASVIRYLLADDGQ